MTDRGVEGTSSTPFGDHLFAAAFRVSPVAMIITSVATGVVVDVNDAALALQQRTREAMLGHSVLELGVWADPERRAEFVSALHDKRQVRDYEMQMRRPSGELRDLVVSADLLEVDGEACIVSSFSDITAQRNAERSLDEIQRLGQVGNWEVELGTGKVTWSRETQRIYGQAAPDSLDEYFAVVHPDDRDGMQRTVRQAIEDGVSYEYLHRIYRPNGEQRWVCGRGTPERDATGTVVRLTGTVQDITERQVVHARLEASEQRYRRMIETSGHGVAVIDLRGIVTFANAALAAMLGTTQPSLVGQPFEELVAPADRARISELSERRRHGLTESYDLHLLRADGSQVVAEVSATPLVGADGVFEGALATFSDVTLRRQAQDLRARLAAIVESSPDAISSSDLDGRILTWNASAERLFGYTAEEAIGSQYTMLVPTDRIDSFRENTTRVLRGEVVIAETQRQRKDGSIVDVSVRRSPVVDASGKVVAVSTIARDITAQKRLEASLREAEERVRHLQKMEAIGALAGGIAHDFNNIVTVVLSSVTLIEEQLQRSDPMLEDVKAIRESAERAATLTRQLLAFSRKQVLEPRVINVDRVINGMEQMLRRLLGERVKLVFSTAGAGNTLIDPTQFEQVLMNLAVNARDAMPHGGQLTIESANVTVDDALAAGTGARPGGFVRVTVRDTGIGMDEDTRSRMFEPFFTTKEKGKGTGLGLATVFGIVRQSGGFMRVTSAPGQGTSIDVYVPRTDRSERVRDDTSVPMSMKGTGETILLVEDEEPVRRLVERLLRRQGYDVVSAANAGEAMLIAEKGQKIHLLLTDVVMPIMNGRQLAERLKASRPDLRIIYMSGYHDDEVLREMLGSDDVVYLQKPVRRELLVRKIRELLDRP